VFIFFVLSYFIGVQKVIVRSFPLEVTSPLYLIDDDYPKRTQHLLIAALLTSSAAILIHTAVTIGFVINDSSQVVKLKMAAT